MEGRNYHARCVSLAALMGIAEGFVAVPHIAPRCEVGRSSNSIREPHTLRRNHLHQAQVEISPELIRKTAGLAQIQIADGEVDDLLPRTEEFIGFVEAMEEVDGVGDGAFAMLACGSDFLREDSEEKFANVAAVMENMPAEERNYLRVPKVGEDEG